MAKVERILVALDFSDASKRTVEYASELARDLKAELVVVHVINQRELDAIKSIQGYPGAPKFEDLLKARFEERGKAIQEYLGEAGCGDLVCQHDLRYGVPWEEILKSAEEKCVNLIVMGTKGRGNMKSTLFGSHAEKVFRHSPIPVLSVRPDDHCRMPAE